MKISLAWLSDFIDLTITDSDEIARRVTSSVAEVDEVEVRGELLENCSVGKIVALGRHPNADRLSLCSVETDRGIKRVVCGGTNLREGMIIAFAHVGAKVKHGKELVELTKAKIRGEESEGMICAAQELELEGAFPARPEEGERPVMDLTSLNLAPATSLREALGMSDVVLHIDNHAITHRPDLFSHIGFAREFVALGLGTWKKRAEQTLPKFSKTPLPFHCIVERKDLVPMYRACLLEVEGTGTTPDWMRRRLEATGWRSISLPVDITNFVMMEMGMPLHSFDSDDFRGDIHIRATKPGERITTLDGIERPLPEGAIVISDDEGIFDLLGVMGGLRSSTKDSTRKIYLHSAALDPAMIRRTVIETGHRTDAATTYEKGVPLSTVSEGFFRALELFLTLVPGARIVSSLEKFGEETKPKSLTLSLERVTRMLGTKVSSKKAAGILTDLGFKVKATKTALSITPPPWRLGDIHGDHDLIEEIGRIGGYDSIEPTLPAASIAPPPRDTRIATIRDSLKEERYTELLPLSLVGSSLLAKCDLNASEAIRIANPIGEEMSLLRTSIVPSLLEHAQRNILHAEENLKTFSVGRTFKKGPAERNELVILFADLRPQSARKHENLKRDPFLILKRDVRGALAPLGLNISFSRDINPPPFAHPGRAAILKTEGKVIGSLAEIHPRIRERFDLHGKAAIAIIDLDAILSTPAKTTLSVPLPRFPEITYDVTVTRDQSASTEELLTKLTRISNLLERVEIVDLFAGDPLPEGKFNLTLRFIYRAPDRTLTEEEAQKVHAEVLKILG